MCVQNEICEFHLLQIALIDVLRELNISPSGMVGHSAGEIACGYADNCLTKEETILCAYYRGFTILKYGKVDGLMAAIGEYASHRNSCSTKMCQVNIKRCTLLGLTYDKLKTRLPEDIDIACVNSCNNCTISGPVDSVRNFIDKLRVDDVFAREINSSHVPFHSRYVKDIGPVLLQYLQKVQNLTERKSQPPPPKKSPY